MATTGPSLQTGVAPQIRKLRMRYPELSQGDIARKVGCSTSNVSQVLSVFLREKSPEDLAEFQNNKAEIYDALQFRLLASLTPEKIANAKVMEAVTASAILEDKARLVRGQATGINVVALLDVVQAIKQRDSNPRVIVPQSADE